MAIIGNQLQSTNYVSDQFSGNGSTVAYTLSLAPASAASIAVYISGLYQTPGVAYTVSGTTLTFTGAPPSGTNNIYVLYLGVQNQNLVPVNGSITPVMLNNANVIYWSVSNTNIGIGNTSPAAPLVVGQGIGTFTNPLAQFGGNANSWVQVNVQNANNGNNASTDLVLARSDGTDTSGYIDIGVNSNTYSQAAYSLMTPRSGYVFTNGGDLFLGTQTAHAVTIHTGNTTTGSARLTVAANGNVGINNTTPAATLTVSGSTWNNSTGGDVVITNSANVGASITLRPANSASYANGWSMYAGASAAAIGDGSIGLWNHTTASWKMSIDQSGRMRLPSQPVCMIACQGADLNWNSGGIINFGGNTTYQSTTIVDNYNSFNYTNSRYTAPIAGNYYISATANGRYYNGGVPRARIRKNGASIGNDLHIRGNSTINGSGGDLDQRCMAIILPLAAGDYIDFYVYENGFDTFGSNYFCAYMLG